MDVFGRPFSLIQERVVPRVVSSSERIFSRKRGNHEKENRWSCARCSAGVRGAWAQGGGAGGGEAEREAALQVRVPVEIQLVVSVGGRGAPNAHRRI